MVSKSENRLARKLKKQEEFEKKKVRQALEPVALKRVGEGAVPDVSKTVKEAPARVAERSMEWSRENADVVGSWSWGPRSCLNDEWDSRLHPFLTEYEKKTWNQVYTERTTVRRRRVQKHLSYSVVSICKEAQDRLVELEMDDVDKVFRFRLSGRRRLYGIQRLQLFMVLWWDPEHNVYPTTPN